SSAFLYLIDPATAPTITGTVIGADTGQPVAAEVSAGMPFTTSTSVDGSFSLQLVSGTYDLAVIPADANYAPAELPGLSINDSETISQDFVLYPYCDLFSDDVENGNQGWTTEGSWAITTESANSGSHSWTDSPGGNYFNNSSVALTSPVIDVSGSQGVRLEFASFCETESSYDYCVLEINAGGSWDEIARYDGIDSSWQDLQFELPQLANSTAFSFRFRLETDVSIVENGWHVDDIRVRTAGPQCLSADADVDGIDDLADNCTEIANPDQRDTDGDGFGNICDPDLDGSGLVNFADLNILSDNFFQSGDLDSDFDGDGQTNFVDLSILADFFFQAPGPAAGQ
ncbi:MAG: hypothetical protein HKM98_02155, partial [Gammaproteobacteria bacterium]|nr:hypothetical protein [Gammaproteobacteria bacterium]